MKREVPERFVHRLICSGPVVLVTSRYRDRTNVMAVGWVTPLSQWPPLVGIAVHPATLSHDLIKRSGQFALNIPGRPLAEAVVKVGTRSGYEVGDKFAWAGLTPAEPKQIEVPLIEECLAWLECGVIEAFELGDHTFFVGEVLSAEAEEEAFDEIWLLPDEEVKPLHHLGGSSFAVLGSRIEVKVSETGETSASDSE